MRSISRLACMFAILAALVYPGLCRKLRIAWLAPGPNSGLPVTSHNSVNALRLALSSVVANPNILNGHSLGVKYFNVDCSTQGTMAAALSAYKSYNPDLIIGPPCPEGIKMVAQLASFWNLPVFSWYNSDVQIQDKNLYPTLIKMSPSLGIIGESVHHIFQYNNWSKFSFVYETSSPWDQYEEAVRTSKQQTNIRLVTSHPVNGSMPDHALVNMFRKIMNEAWVVVFAVPNAHMRRYMLAAGQAGMADGNYVFIQLDHEMHTDQEIRSRVMSNGKWKYGDTNDPAARQAYQSLIHIVTDPMHDDDTSPPVKVPRNRFEEFARLAATETHASKPGWTLPQGGAVDTNSLFLYDAILVWAVLVDKILATGGNPKDGKGVVSQAQDFMADGATGYISFNDQLARDGKTFILSMDSYGNFVPMERLKFNGTYGYSSMRLRPTEELTRQHGGQVGARNKVLPSSGHSEINNPSAPISHLRSPVPTRVNNPAAHMSHLPSPVPTRANNPPAHMSHFPSPVPMLPNNPPARISHLPSPVPTRANNQPAHMSHLPSPGPTRANNQPAHMSHFPSAEPMLPNNPPARISHLPSPVPTRANNQPAHMSHLPSPGPTRANNQPAHMSHFPSAEPMLPNNPPAHISHLPSPGPTRANNPPVPFSNMPSPGFSGMTNHSGHINHIAIPSSTRVSSQSVPVSNGPSPTPNKAIGRQRPLNALPFPTPGSLNHQANPLVKEDRAPINNKHDSVNDLHGHVPSSSKMNSQSVPVLSNIPVSLINELPGPPLDHAGLTSSKDGHMAQAIGDLPGPAVDHHMPAPSQSEHGLSTSPKVAGPVDPIPQPPSDTVSILLAKVQALEQKIREHEFHSHHYIPDHTHTPAPYVGPVHSHSQPMASTRPQKPFVSTTPSLAGLAPAPAVLGSDPATTRLAKESGRAMPSTGSVLKKNVIRQDTHGGHGVSDNFGGGLEGIRPRHPTAGQLGIEANQTMEIPQGPGHEVPGVIFNGSHRQEPITDTKHTTTIVYPDLGIDAHLQSGPGQNAVDPVGIILEPLTTTVLPIVESPGGANNRVNKNRGHNTGSQSTGDGPRGTNNAKRGNPRFKWNNNNSARNKAKNLQNSENKNNNKPKFNTHGEFEGSQARDYMVDHLTGMITGTQNSSNAEHNLVREWLSGVEELGPLMLGLTWAERQNALTNLPVMVTPVSNAVNGGNQNLNLNTNNAGGQAAGNLLNNLFDPFHVNPSNNWFNQRLLSWW